MHVCQVAVPRRETSLDRSVPESKVNPYAPPTSLEESQDTYCTVNTVRLGIDELWHVTFPNVITFLFAVAAKWLGIRLQTRSGIACDVHSIVAIENLPPYVSAQLAEVCSTCEALGFRRVFGQKIKTVGQIECCVILLLNRSGTAAAYAIYARSFKKVEKLVSFVTFSRGGEIWVTTNGRRRLRTPPNVRPRYCSGMDVGDLLAVHEQRLAKETHQQLLSLDEAELREAVLETATRTDQFHRDRGVYVPLSQREVAALEREERQSSEWPLD